MGNLHHTCTDACVPMAVRVSQIGGMLEPYGPLAPEHMEGYLPDCGPPSSPECATHYDWAQENYPNGARVLCAGLPGESDDAREARIAARIAALRRRPYVTGMRENDSVWGWYHTWLADGTLVKFRPIGNRWGWDARDQGGVADTIEDGREAAGRVLGVPVEMTREAFGALMGWNKPQCRVMDNRPFWTAPVAAHFGPQSCAACGRALAGGERYWQDTGTDAHVVWHFDCRPEANRGTGG